MEKRVLVIATVPSMIGQFNMNNIKLLQDLGYEVDVAADFNDTSIWPPERIEKFRKDLEQLDIEQFQIDFSRSIFKLNRHVESFKEVLKLIRERNYSFIHTHTPIASSIVRLAAHKTGTKVIYTAHGFHFYDGAPIKNWVIFYPIEKWLSRWTDVLITINKEDYKRAAEHFHAKKTVYIPGVGVDIQKFAPGRAGRERIRRELGVIDNQLMLLSVGELNENKNHEAVIRAISGIPQLTYVIVGKGELSNRLEAVAADLGVDLRLTGYRTDVADFYEAADAYILPSIREGLNVSLMEAMASSLPCLVGSIRGNVDLVDEKGGYLFRPENKAEIRDRVEKIIQMPIEDRQSLGEYNLRKIRSFSLLTVQTITSEIYKGYEHLLKV
jgi:glycosyltransferase involved in cell wall biosynthesis